MNFLESLKNMFSRNQHTHPAHHASMEQKILQILEQTQEEELTCDEVFALLDQFTEMAARGEDVAKMMPLVQQHLGICGDCREEYEALLRVLQVPA